jgi:hypothetical protein
VTDTPLFADPLYGLRFWRVTVDDRGDEWLSAPHHDTLWPPDGQWLHANCPTGHAAPAPGCDCGAHAWHPRRRSARDVLAVRGVVAGIVEAQGAIEVHEDGFRAERARPHALIATPLANRARIQRLADRYAATVVEVSGPKALLAYCRERGIGMDDDVVATLLGQGDPAERKRARFRQAGKNALRVAAAFAIAAVIVVLGLELAVDPPGERTLHGRTGEIHTH